jgi:hypothetical protein
MRLLIGGMDSCNEACVKVQKIGFHPVAEDDTGGWHQRFQYELFPLLKHASNKTSLGMAAQKWLANDIEEPLIFPRQPDSLPRLASTEFGYARRHIKGG